MLRNAEKNRSGLSRNQDSIMPEDCEEFTLLIQKMKNLKTLKNARRKLEIPMTAAMPCKISKSQHRVTCSSTGNCKTKFACIVEADESTRRRLEGSLPNDHKDHIAGILRTSLFLWKIHEAKATADREWEKLEKFPAWQLTKVRTKKGYEPI